MRRAIAPGRLCLSGGAMSSNVNALVTGAAARIGAAIARRLHQRGCNVVVHYNASSAAATGLVEEMNAVRAGSAVSASADISQMEGVDSLAEQTRRAVDNWGGDLGVLVNNASRFYPTALAETRLYQWEDLVNSNLRGPYFLILELVETLRAANGSVVNILDIHSERPMRGHPVYSISKAGLRMLTRSLALELAPDVRVNGVSPGAILWPDREESRHARDEILAKVALGRLGDPEDIAAAVAYLALDAPYMTGEVLTVDGGRSLNM